MELSEERIYDLLRSFSEEKATESELEELYEWVAHTSDDSEIKKYIKELLDKNAGVAFQEVDWEGLYHQILENTEEKGKLDADKNRSWFKIAVVILILIIGSGTVYWFTTDNKWMESPLIAVQPKDTLSHHKIQPGSTKARLTAGHQSVVLNAIDTSFSLGGNKVKINDGDVRIAKAKPVEYTLTVPRGGTYSLVLADGTKVWLNADSKLVYPSVFTGDSRDVELSGEAYFDVKTDAEHPFHIHTKTQDISVLGTELNVAAYEDEVNKTTLVEGKVAVESGGEKKMLKPGQQVILRQAQDDVRQAPLRQAQGDQRSLGQTKGRLVVQKADVSQEIAWKNGYFRFDKADIYTIMKRLERWYDIEVEYEEEMPTHYFGAIMNRKNDIVRILRLLEATGEVHFEIEERTVKVSR